MNLEKAIETTDAHRWTQIRRDCEESEDHPVGECVSGRNICEGMSFVRGTSKHSGELAGRKETRSL
jgi:hypothetical protein